MVLKIILGLILGLGSATIATMSTVHQRAWAEHAQRELQPADPSGEHHHHAICDRCGKMDAFEDPELERVLEGVASRLGYEAGGHDLVLHGACPDCKRSPV